MNRRTVFYFAQFTNFDDAMIIDISVISICPSKLPEMNLLNLITGVPEFSKISIHIFTISLNKLAVICPSVCLSSLVHTKIWLSYLREQVKCQWNKQVDQPMEIVDRIHPREEYDPGRYHKCGRFLHQSLMPNIGLVTRHNHPLPRILVEPFSIL